MPAPHTKQYPHNSTTSTIKYKNIVYDLIDEGIAYKAIYPLSQTMNNINN